MKKFLLLAIPMCLTATATYANGGVIHFRGALVKAPCETNASDLAYYAANNRAYLAARKVQSGPSCAGMDNTQFVSKARVVSEDGTADVISVAYN
ncbi:hypothetical protein ACFOKJ_03260 [Vogesella amnigena]|uniref:Type 1 fimbrial protein n=1 Tax=Vogesella amnigena TaxID=1507449 RepID=A0ABV7TPE8_9NEIS